MMVFCLVGSMLVCSMDLCFSLCSFYFSFLMIVISLICSLVLCCLVRLVIRVFGLWVFRLVLENVVWMCSSWFSFVCSMVCRFGCVEVRCWLI